MLGIVRAVAITPTARCKNFLECSSTTAIVETPQMFEPRDSSARRNILDGGFIVLLLSVAIASGYVILSPGSKSAPQAALVGAVVEVRPPVPDGAGVPAPAESVTPAAPAVAIPDGPKPAAAPKAVESPAPAKAAVAPPIERVRTVPDARPPIAPSKPWRPVEPTSDTPWPSPIVTGRVVDSEHKPLPGASIVVRGVEIRTDAEGAFKAERVPPDAALLVKLPGFEKTYVAPTRGPVEVVLKPQMIKAAYLTYFGIGDRGIRGRVLDLAARTELNAVVIDVKGDRGWILYQTEVPQALAIGAQGPATLKDFDSLMADLKARGIYTIARIVTFKDNILANARPDLAITDTRTGKPWIDNEKLAWVDPFQEEVWAYNIALGQEAIRRGFDEVQFDYVRFPTDGKLSATKYAKPNNRETRLPTIAGFLGKARTRARRLRGVRGRRPVRLHRVQRERHRHRPAHRGARAAPRLHLPDGLPVRLPQGHPRISQPGAGAGQGRLSRACG